LHRYARRLGISGRVEFVGRLDRAAICELFAVTDVFALPTRKEAFGIAVLEAMAAGLPVVAMDRCGVADLVTPGCEGFLATDPAEFAARIGDLLLDETQRLAMSQQAVQKTERFSWDNVVPQHLALYELAVSRQDES
jgi:glycogen(starch) synthase